MKKEDNNDKLSRCQAIFNATLDGLILLDRKGKVVDLNDAATKILGYSKDEMMGKDLEELRTNEYAGMCRDNFNKALTGKRAVCDCSIVGSNREEIFADNLLKRVEIDGEEFVLISFHDITPQKEAEKRLEVEMETLRKMNELMVGREERIIELKDEIRSIKENGLDK